MFTSDRIFSVQNLVTGLVEWYFQSREGSRGPFATKKYAEDMLKNFVKISIETGHTGGRAKNKFKTAVRNLIKV